MRIFGQLNETEQNNAIHHCVHLIVEDMLDSDSFELESEKKCEEHQEEDKKIQDHINEILEQAKELPQEEQFNYILQDQSTGEVIFDIALGMARDAWYPEEEEFVIFPASLSKENDTDEVEEILNIIIDEDDKKSLN